MRRTASLLATLVVAALPAAADDEGLKRCRAIPAASARLACYDAIPLAGPPASRAAPAAAQAPAGSATPARAPVASPPSGDPAATTPAVVPPGTASRQGLESSFGLEGRAPVAELPAIESHIPGTFDGWSQNTLIRLANGQVWQVMDDGTRRMRLQDPKVRVRRGAMGAFYLEFEAHNHAPRVRRVQ
jgi:hypothetical protein